jgi:hypothetical protein
MPPLETDRLESENSGAYIHRSLEAPLSYPFPEDFFGPADELPDGWQDEPDVRRAVEWLRSFMTQEDWEARRVAAATRLYDMALHKVDPDDKGRLFHDRDTFAWYLFLAEASLDHPWNYEPNFGSRVVPVFAAIGRELDVLRAIDGIEDRVSRLPTKDRSQPNGTFFELLVAACYAKQGGVVRFVPEEPGRRKTHDMDVDINGISYAVECKRMETGEYGERERAKMRLLWNPCGQILSELERSALGDVNFDTPLDTVPDDYLFGKLRDWMLSSSRSIKWDDGISTGHLSDLDLTPLRTELKHSILQQGSARLTEIITGEYIRNRNFLQILRMKFADNPRWIEDCDFAVVLRWQSTSDAATSGKARDVIRKLSEANEQLPEGRRSIVHIGFEAVEGDDVERARFDKIVASTQTFDPQGKRLEYVYCHYFVPESPPDQSWAYDETSQERPIRPEGPSPLKERFLVMPPGTAQRRGPHWS